MEDSLFPLSPTDGQRLGDDSMEGVAADLLLADGNDGGSLFNDSLDEDSHAATTKTTSTAAASPVHQQHDLNDSLNFDTTQLPFDNDTAEPLTHSSSKAGNDVPVETKRPTAGFELAKNISISPPTELERKGKQYSVDIESAVATKVPEPYAGDYSNIKLSISSSATLPTASKTGASTKAKSPKVVPSFGRRKTKSSPHKAITEGNKSPNSDSTSDSMVPVGNLVADDRDIPNDRQDNEGGERVIEGDDQYVPQTSTGNTGKPQKASKKKTPPQQTTTATKDSGQRKKSVASKKTGMPKIPSVGAVDDQNMTNEGESVPHNTTTTDKEDQDGLSADKTSSKRQSSLKGKKLAEREEKKREREEKKKEAEQKKLEREQKKREAEAMKAEKERLKKERQLELERKKAEKEQKRIELALKKAERMTSKKEGKQTGAKGSRKSKQSDDSSSNAAEGHTGSSLVVEQSSDDRETEMNVMEKVPDRTDGNPDQMETKPDQMGNESDQLQIELEQMEDEPDQEVDRKNNDRDRQEPVQNPNQEEGNEKVRSNETSVAGVTAPEEGASLATDPSNTNTTTNHPLPLPASITSLGYGHSTPGTQSQEPSESAAILPDDAADEGACNIPTSGDTNSVGDDPGPVSSQGQSPEDTSTLQPSTVLKERNTASDGKVKIVFGKVKTTTQKKDEAKATTQHTNSLKPTQAEKKRNSAPKKTSRQLKPNTASTTSKENDKSLPRRKRSRTSSPKPKKRARAQEGNNRPGSSGGDGEGKREESSNSGVGPVWVQCEKASCQKWRKLGDCSDPLSLPDSWTCSMNTDVERISCSADEENWSNNMGDSQEFVETPYIPGSLVWAKMDSYPWWPAMVEGDPDDETYYELGKQSTSNVPVRYHVVFFDTPVSRGWVSSFHVHPYSTDTDHNITTGVSVPQKLRRNLKEAKRQACQASTMPITTRLIECSFSKRFRRMSSKKRKKTKSGEEEDESETCSAGSLNTSGSRGSGRKSARLGIRAVVGDREEGEGVEGEEGGSGDAPEVNLGECVTGCEGVGSEEGEDVQ